MSRVVKNRHAQHVLTISEDPMRQIVLALIGGGPKHSYIHIDGMTHAVNGTRFLAGITGEKTLRALAKAILKEVGDE